DQISAVILGTAVNNDGSNKIGFTAPSVSGQADVIAAAHRAAGVAADSISYVEAHGTGTPLGDPIEMEALTRAFRQSAPEAAAGSCAIGSIKTNIGHLDTAAGVTGLIKTALQLSHRELAPSLHFLEPNPKIDFSAGPFAVSRERKPWVAEGKLRAGVSSFGMGGANAHAVLEEAPPAEPSDPHAGPELLILSARTQPALDAMAANLESFLAAHPGTNIADAAFTLQVGRTAHSCRRAWIREPHDTTNRSLSTRTAEAGVRPVFLFPGQGAQSIDMARELYEAEVSFREDVNRCAALLEPSIGVDLRTVLFPDARDAEGARERLKQTAFAQPALFTVEWALATLWMRWGVEPTAAIGHSIGEYVAACLAGVFSLEDALTTVAARGRLMQQMQPGAMLAVALGPGELRPMLTGDLSLAAINAPSLCVISGPFDAIARFEEAARSRGIECRRLHTSHAFHSRMMDAVLEAFAAHLRTVELSTPKLPFVSNRTGTWISAAEAINPAYWVDQLRGTVEFSRGVETLLGAGHRVFLEAGPGQTLCGLVKQHSPGNSRLVIVPSLGGVRDAQSDRVHMVRALGEIWSAGVNPDWIAVHSGKRRRRIKLPTYAFEKKKFFIEPRKALAHSSPKALSGERLPLDQWFYAPTWNTTAPLSVAGANLPGHFAYVVLADCDLGKELAEKLRQANQEVFTAEDSVAHPPGPYGALLRHVRKQSAKPLHIVHMWTANPGVHSAPANLDRSFYSLLHVLQAMEGIGDSGEARVTIVSKGMCHVADGEPVQPENATLPAACLVIPQEFPGVGCRSIDMDGAALCRKPTRAAGHLLAELFAPHDGQVVAYRGRQRLERRFARVVLPAAVTQSAPVKPGGVYLITGGLGGVGLELAESFAAFRGVRLALLGRSAPSQTAIPQLDRLAGMGAEVFPVQADAGDLAQLRLAIQKIEERFGPINGAVHAAGVAGGSLISGLTPEIASRVFAPKLQGTLNLEAALQGQPLDFFALCSSQRSIVGAPGRADYCAANAFVDDL
ncbi:MAG: SDR family NAD(P)-dependent oxidoreductase, partial [Acidobacteriota bacterium]|nr:SDR family NAD(P)-dependent oxidoreductase [Acidobacteriota bacterium]